MAELVRAQTADSVVLGSNPGEDRPTVSVGKLALSYNPASGGTNH
jgi:hypothetical protein